MRFIRRVLLFLVLLVVVWIGLAESRWLPRPTEVQRKALALLASPPTRATGQHNGFPGYWLVSYDIPAADVDKVIAADIAKYGPTGPTTFDVDMPSTAKGHYPQQDLANDAAGLCGREDDCLSKTRAGLDAARKLVAGHALLLDHMRALQTADHFHDEFRAEAGTFPNYLALSGLQLTDAAVHFADGDRSEALTRVCAVAAASRTNVTHTDFGAMPILGAIAYQRAAYLFAGMLAEMPVDAALPESCTRAFAPVAEAELDVCDSMKTEFATSDFFVQSLLHYRGANDPAFIRMVRQVLYNRRDFEAMRAVSLAAQCASADADIKREGERIRAADLSDVGGWQGTLFDPVGIAYLSEYNAMLGYDQTPLRAHDLQRVDELVLAALGLRSKAAAAAGTSIEQLASAAGSLPKDIRWDADKHMLSIARSWKRHEDPADFSIPLPGTRLH